MESVTGIGGVFWKARDPAKLRAWYRDHLGVALEDWGGAVFRWHEPNGEKRLGATVWNAFDADTRHFDPSTTPFMINYRVGNLDAMIAQLEAAQIEVLGREDSEFGGFAWVLDCEGNKVELWQPPVESTDGA